MATTKIDICNQALIKVGQDLISSLDTTSSPDDGSLRSAKLCNALYDQALDEILRLHTWNCCMKRAQPTKLEATPPFGFDYAFQLPNDWLRVVNVYDNINEIQTGTEWVIEGSNILCNYDTIYLKYIYKPTNVGVLDALCTQAFICNLAIKLCIPLHLDDNWSARLINELHQIILPNARSIDTLENKQLALEESYWITGSQHDSPYI